jgi:hypothetical protein
MAMAWAELQHSSSELAFEQRPFFRAASQELLVPAEAARKRVESQERQLAGCSEHPSESPLDQSSVRFEAHYIFRLFLLEPLRLLPGSL